MQACDKFEGYHQKIKKLEVSLKVTEDQFATLNNKILEEES